MNINPEYVLEVEDLGVSFDGFKAVDGFNFYLSKTTCTSSSALTAPARPPCST